ncbi:hypothetical protein NONS58_12710 [Nitrosococcus oceani]|nr:hypothetical protein NONS58_12710 [Nitrosococcus oceani]
MQKHHLLMGLLLSILTLQTAWAESFNHNTWNNLLMAHVSPVNGGAATVVDYQKGGPGIVSSLMNRATCF